MTFLDGEKSIRTITVTTAATKTAFAKTPVQKINVIDRFESKKCFRNQSISSSTSTRARVRSFSIATPFLQKYNFGSITCNHCRNQLSLMNNNSPVPSTSKQLLKNSNLSNDETSIKLLATKTSNATPPPPTTKTTTKRTYSSVQSLNNINSASISSTTNLANRSKQLLSSVSDNLKSFVNSRRLLKTNTENVTVSDKATAANVAASSPNIHQIHLLRPKNRLRATSTGSLLTAGDGGGCGGSYGSDNSQFCSKCSSLLSMLSSSKYSLCVHGNGFIPVPEFHPDKNTFLCKLCLNEIDYHDMFTIQQCSCHFCFECMRSYVQYEIAEGAYDIACPDAQCNLEGVLTILDIENLVPPDIVQKHKKYRLNREIDVDKSRLWCPRVGCETVCHLCPSENCQPQSVHCTTCKTNFCSNCKNDWHPELSCDENTKKLVKEGKKTEDISATFDWELIKRCPMCNVPIEKDEGCAQMMCKRCRHVFCWYCLANLDEDFLLMHYDKGPCKNKLGHSRASVIWHRAQVIGLFVGISIVMLIASPILLLVSPCIVCCKCRTYNNVNNKFHNDNSEDVVVVTTTSAPSAEEVSL